MKVQVIIDRIEERKLAVLEIEGLGGDFLWPVRFLPPGVHDGSVLDFTIEENPEEEARLRMEVTQLRRKLLEKEPPGEKPDF